MATQNEIKAFNEAYWNYEGVQVNVSFADFSKKSVLEFLESIKDDGSVGNVRLTLIRTKTNGIEGVSMAMTGSNMLNSPIIQSEGIIADSTIAEAPCPPRCKDTLKAMKYAIDPTTSNKVSK